MHHRRLHSDRAGAEVGRDTVQRGFTPQTALRHDLVELLELAQARNVAGSFGLPGLRDGKATGACEGGILAEFLIDKLRLGRLTGEHDADKGLQESEETLGRSSGETGRSDARMKRVRTNGERRPGARSNFVQDRRVFVEGGPAEEQPGRGLGLSFRVRRGWIFPTLNSLLGLSLVELPELLVVSRRRGLELPVIKFSKDVEPEGLRVARCKVALWAWSDRVGFVYAFGVAKARRRWDWTLAGRCSRHHSTTCLTGVASNAAWMREIGQCPTSEPRLRTKLVIPWRDS